MKIRFWIACLLLVCLTACAGTPAETTAAVTQAEPIGEPLVHKVFMSNTYLVLESVAGGFAAYHTETPEDRESYIPIPCALPSELRYESAVPVFVGGGGGSGECRFVIALKNGTETTYVGFDNFAYTDFKDWMEFTYSGIIPAEDFEPVD